MRMSLLLDWPITVPELRLCLSLNRIGDQVSVRRLFMLVSRLGDGVVWYTLMLLLPVFGGRAGALASLHLAAVGLVALMIYRSLKRYTRRPRPYARYQSITAHIAPLDEFSFPSGHTLHAISFTWVATYHFPGLALMLWPFAVLVAASRVVLGLHYPSDVLAAMLIGIALAQTSIAIIT